MKKNALTALVFAAAMSLALGGATYANCGKCPGDKASKKECKTTDAGCKAMKACSDAEKALQEDLAKLEKGVPADQQAAFLKAHQENLKKYFDAKTECKKSCAAKGEKAEKDSKSCAHGDKKS